MIYLFLKNHLQNYINLIVLSFFYITYWKGLVPVFGRIPPTTTEYMRTVSDSTQSQQFKPDACANEFALKHIFLDTQLT